jgi:osmoprotectant transport system ATP-binding protein
MAEPVIRLEKVGRRFNAVDAVLDVTFDVQAGETCVLVGPSGCGKTTTLKMINRMVEPSAGQILVRGLDTRELDPVELRRSIGYVIQQVGLFPHMTVEENVAIILRLLGYDPARRRRRVAELLELVGLPPAQYLDRKPAQLSGGQQQRVGVARALAADPDIVLMDEPFGAVDPLVRKQLQAEMKRIQSELHKTIVFVTHDLSEAFFLADRLVLLRDGHLVQQGSPHDLLFAPSDPYTQAFLAEAGELAGLGFQRISELAEPLRPGKLDRACATVGTAMSVIEVIRRIARVLKDGGYQGRDFVLVEDARGAAVGTVSLAALVRAVGGVGATTTMDPSCTI